MLKRVLLLAVLLISLGSATSLSASHLSYMGTIDGTSYYIDKDTVQKYGKNAYVWVKIVTKEGSEVWGHILVSRYGKAYTITELRGDGGEQKLDPHEEFRPILPNSPIEKIVELIW
ncbi:hypothetical protein [Veillonella sp. VA137]|uniref:hypothetical protein n=1 Tax=Veillonella sp. VA137 TaxID=741828 RepID=UPI000F8D44E6|nr:hypothetical protein [Veillonella sp. VA137]